MRDGDVDPVIFGRNRPVVKLPLAAAKVVPPQLSFLLVGVVLEAARVGEVPLRFLVPLIAVVRSAAEDRPAVVAKVVLSFLPEIKQPVDDGFVLCLVRSIFADFGRRFCFSARHQRAEHVRRAVPLAGRQGQRRVGGEGSVLLPDLRLIGLAKVQPEFVVLVDPLTIGLTAFQSRVAGVVEKVRDCIRRAAGLPLQQIFPSGFSKELSNTVCAEVELSGPRAPQVQREPVASDFPLLGKLLPHPPQRTGDRELFVANLNPLADLRCRVDAAFAFVGDLNNARFALGISKVAVRFLEG